MRNSLKWKGLGLAVALTMVLTFTCGAWAADENFYLNASMGANPTWADGTTWNTGSMTSDPYPGKGTLSSKAVLAPKANPPTAINVTLVFDTTLARDLAELYVPQAFNGQILELKKPLTTETLTIATAAEPYSIHLNSDEKGSLTLKDAGIKIEGKATGNTNYISITGKATNDGAALPLLTIGVNGTIDKGKITWTQNVGMDGGDWIGVATEEDGPAGVKVVAAAIKAGNGGLTMVLSRDITLYAGTIDPDDATISTLTAVDGDFKITPTADGDFIANGGAFSVLQNNDVVLSGKAKLKGDITANGGDGAKALVTGTKKGDSFTITDAKGNNSITLTATAAASKLAMKGTASLDGSDGLTLMGDGTDIFTITGSAKVKGTLTLRGENTALYGMDGNDTLTADIIEVYGGAKLFLGKNGALKLNTGGANISVKAEPYDDVLVLTNDKLVVSRPEMVEGKVKVSGLTKGNFVLDSEFTISKDATLTFDDIEDASGVTSYGASSKIKNNGTLVFTGDGAVLASTISLENNGVLAIESISNISSLLKNKKLTFGPGYTLRIDGAVKPDSTYTFDVTGGASFDISTDQTLTLAQTNTPNITGNGMLELHGTGAIAGGLYLDKDASLLLDNDNNSVTVTNLIVSGDAGAKIVLKKDVWDNNALTVKALHAKGVLIDTTDLSLALSDDKTDPSKVSCVILNTSTAIADDELPTVEGTYIFTSGDGKPYDIPLVVVSADNGKKLTIEAKADDAKEHEYPKYSLSLDITVPTAVANKTIAVSADSFPTEGYKFEVKNVTLKNTQGADQSVLSAAKIKWTLSDDVKVVRSDDVAAFTVVSTDVVAGKNYTLTVAVKYTPAGSTEITSSDVYTISVRKGEEIAATIEDMKPEDAGGAAVKVNRNTTTKTVTTAVTTNDGKAPSKLSMKVSGTVTGTIYAWIVRGLSESRPEATANVTNDFLKGEIDLMKIFKIADKDAFKIILSDRAPTASSLQTAATIGDGNTHIYTINITSDSDYPVYGQSKNLTLAKPTMNTDVDPAQFVEWSQNFTTYLPQPGDTITWSDVTGDGIALNGNKIQFTKTGNITGTAKATLKNGQTTLAETTVDIKASNVQQPTNPSNPDNGGGCAAGFAGLALLVVAPMFLKKK